MEIKSIEELVNSFEWTFAKTMPNNPHCYIIRREVNTKDYDRLYWYIYDHPTMVNFYGTEYRTATIGNHMYWVMPKPQDSYIINRKEL